MSNFKEQKNEEIAKLDKVNIFLEKILDSEVSILQGDEDSKLRSILNKNKTYLRKLRKNEFEIAIVGLEKAGKSTFANALIKSNILPSADERCTFTSTRLVYGSEDKAVIKFYTESEFNAIFQSMLKDINYENYQNITYKDLSEDEFQRYFDSLEETDPNLYKAHLGRTDKEILDILKAKDRLRLDGTEEIFSGDDVYSERFQSYIKGENNGEDTSKPRSLKYVEIQSTKLQQLKTAIIYDVPGFDSPTKIHERQTLERMQKADAIILVASAKAPSITAPSLNIIAKSRDDDGIALSDKMFVFGNKLDQVTKQECIEKNEQKLIDEVVKYQLAEKKRVYVGSALKFLISNNLERVENFSDTFDIEDGIEEIRQGLVDYYRTERFEILQRKIELNMQEFKEIQKKLEIDIN